MNRWNRGVLLAAVVFTLGGVGAGGAATLNAEDAAALPCCAKGCDAGYNRCLSRCVGDDCDLTCFDAYMVCYSNCNSSC